MLPEGWVRGPLATLVAELEAGVSVNSEDRPVRPGEIGVLKTSAVTYGQFDPREHKAVVPADIGRVRTTPKKGGILISRMNTQALVGASAYIDKDYPWLFLPDRLWQTVLKEPEAISGQWLSYVLATPAMRDRMSAIATGTSGSMKNLSKGQVLSLDIKIPPAQEQCKIASILSSVDDTIEKTQAVVEQLEVVKKGLLDDLLTRGIPGRRSEYQKTSTGMVPSNWRIVRLPEVFRYQNGKAFSSKDYCDSGARLVRPGNLGQDGTMSWDQSRTTFLPARYERENPDFIVNGSEILMNLTAQSLEDGFLGRVCWTSDDIPCLLNQRIARMVPLDALVPRFAFWVLAGPQFRAHVGRISNGSKVKHIYNRNLDEALIAVPPRDEQILIAGLLDACLEQMLVTKREVNVLKRLKAGLLSNLLSGAMRVQVPVQEPS